jgi:transposase-like protein
MAFVLMKKKSKAQYMRVFSCFPPFENLKIVISDFESSIIAAISEIFPDAIHHGCWFHFNSCIYKQIQALGYKELYSNDANIYMAFKRFMSIPFAPNDVFEYYTAAANALSKFINIKA